MATRRDPGPSGQPRAVLTEIARAVREANPLSQVRSNPYPATVPQGTPGAIATRVGSVMPAPSTAVVYPTEIPYENIDPNAIYPNVGIDPQQSPTVAYNAPKTLNAGGWAMGILVVAFALGEFMKKKKKQAKAKTSTP